MSFSGSIKGSKPIYNHPNSEVISPESPFTPIDNNQPRQIDPEPSQEPEKSQQNFEFQYLGLVSQLDSTNQNITFSIAPLTALIVKILSDAKDPDFWKADRDFRLKSASSWASAVSQTWTRVSSLLKSTIHENVYVMFLWVPSPIGILGKNW